MTKLLTAVAKVFSNICTLIFLLQNMSSFFKKAIFQDRNFNVTAYNFV